MGPGHILKFIAFFQAAFGLREFEGDAQGPEDELAYQRSMHRRLVVIGSVGGLIGALLGVALMVVALGDKPEAPQPEAKPDEVLGVVLAPVILGMGGLLLGASVACATAPSRFLKGPAGRNGWPWWEPKVQPRPASSAGSSSC